MGPSCQLLRFPPSISFPFPQVVWCCHLAFCHRVPLLQRADPKHRELSFPIPAHSWFSFHVNDVANWPEQSPPPPFPQQARQHHVKASYGSKPRLRISLQDLPLGPHCRTSDPQDAQSATILAMRANFVPELGIIGRALCCENSFHHV